MEHAVQHSSTNRPSEQSIILEEYLFSALFLSIANSRKYDVDHLYDAYLSNFSTPEEEISLVTAFKQVMDKIITIEKYPDSFHYLAAFHAYLNLGKMLGFQLGRNRTSVHQKK